MITIKPCESKSKWDEFITSKPEANFLQSWDYYEFHNSRGNKIVRKIAVNDHDKIIGAYAGVIETAKRGKYMAIAGGPIINWNDKDVIEKIFDDIYEEGTKNHCAFVRIRPQLELSDKSLELMKKLGLKKSPMYLSVEYAGILNLEKSEEEILRDASQGFRRKLRKAEAENITIEKSTDTEIIKTFYKLEVAHAKRQKFVAFSENYLKKQFTAFAENNEAIMYTAKLDGEILAQNFMIFYGNEASYHYGVSSELGSRHSAAPLLHLEAMKDARERGIKRYNLWGIVDTDDTKHRFYGVSEFKRSFGCEELKYTPAHDLVLNKAKYQITKTVENFRKKVRHV